MPVIGWLGVATPRSAEAALTAFRQALAEAGYVEGQNVTIEYRWAQGRYDKLPAMAADLVGLGVDAIVAVSVPGADAAKAASRTIPVIFLVGSDPVAAGLVGSLARPGGNLTGVSALASVLLSKRIELMREVVPTASVMAVLVNSNHPDAERWMREIEQMPRPGEVQLHILKAGTANEIDAAFASLVQRKADALAVDGDPLFVARVDQMVGLAARHAVPVIYSYPEFTRAGGLISYAPTTASGFRQVGIYTAKILRGAEPTDLPVVQPTGFELAVNLKTARGLGITIPPSILGRADEVIE